jgi:UDP-N-acetylglucosamine 2-epimerase (non-hydrolysing)
MRPEQSLAELSAAVFSQLDPVLAEYHPDWVLVQGDTTTVMAASLLAYYHRIRVGHIEAGLRSGDKWQPFPEEINRRVAGLVADLNFAPTEQAKQNLLDEGFPPESVLVTGNPVIDALHYAAQLSPTEEVRRLFNRLGLPASKDKPGIANGARLVLITAHRRENFGRPLEQICQAVKQLAALYPNFIFVYPVHLNPNIQEPVYRSLAGIDNVLLLPPLDYLPWVNLLKRATLLLTDSGGLQEEAPGLNVPTLVMREVTERPEGVQTGALRLVGASKERIVAEARRLLEDPLAHAQMAHAMNPYGDGRAARRIVQGLIDYPSRPVD